MRVASTAVGMRPSHQVNRLFIIHARDKQDHTVLLLVAQRSMKDAVKLALEAENGFGPLWLTYMF
jgi:hypothetical protein